MRILLRHSDSRPWFAWRPVVIGDQVFWLETVRRQWKNDRWEYAPLCVPLPEIEADARTAEIVAMLVHAAGGEIRVSFSTQAILPYLRVVCEMPPSGREIVYRSQNIGRTTRRG